MSKVMLEQESDFKRNVHGEIDIEFYQSNAIQLRNEMMRQYTGDLKRSVVKSLCRLCEKLFGLECHLAH